METLLALDHQIFFWINHLPHTILSDWFALWLSGIGIGGLVWLLISIWLFLKIEKKDHWFFLPVVTAMAFSEVVGNIILKNYFGRGRPPVSLGTINIGGILTDHSFPSTHATFAWALAIVLSVKEPRAKYFFYFLAFLISLSRIYLGDHYPADVVAGSLVGLAIGYFSLLIEQQLIFYRIRKRK